MHRSLLSALLATASALQPNNKMWGTAAWNWGSAVGDAHDAAAELRSALSTEDARRDYLIALRTGRISEASAKLCFALTCQRSGSALPAPSTTPTRHSFAENTKTMPGLRTSRRARRPASTATI